MGGIRRIIFLMVFAFDEQVIENISSDTKDKREEMVVLSKPFRGLDRRSGGRRRRKC